MLLSALVLAGYLVVVAPWAVRNTRLQGVVTIVDTMGGMNLRMGNYEYTPEDRMWDAVSLTGDRNWIHGFTGDFPGQVVTEGHKDKWAQRMAIEYMLSHPGTTLRRGADQVRRFLGPRARAGRRRPAGTVRSAGAGFVVLAAAAILMSYVAVSIAGGAAIWLTPPEWRVHVLMLLPIVVITGVHTLVFGHSRYHIPLVPILAIYAARLWQVGAVRAWRTAHVAKIGAVATVAGAAGGMGSSSAGR